MGERFSKATVTAKIQEHVDYIQSEYGFHPDKGWNQIVGVNDTSAKWRAYGEFCALCRLADDLGLEINQRGTGS